MKRSRESVSCIPNAMLKRVAGRCRFAALLRRVSQKHRAATNGMLRTCDWESYHMRASLLRLSQDCSLRALLVSVAQDHFSSVHCITQRFVARMLRALLWLNKLLCAKDALSCYCALPPSFALLQLNAAYDAGTFFAQGWEWVKNASCRMQCPFAHVRAKCRSRAPP